VRKEEKYRGRGKEKIQNREGESERKEEKDRGRGREKRQHREGERENRERQREREIEDTK